MPKKNHQGIGASQLSESTGSSSAVPGKGAVEWPYCSVITVDYLSGLIRATQLKMMVTVRMEKEKLFFSEREGGVF